MTVSMKLLMVLYILGFLLIAVSALLSGLYLTSFAAAIFTVAEVLKFKRYREMYK